MKKLTNKEVDKRLKGRKIKRIENFINCKTPILFECLKKNCHHIWTTRPSDIFVGSGCPKCAGQLELTNDIIDERLKNKNIKRLDNCLGSITKIKFQCEKQNCWHIWLAMPYSIINNGTGCPKCAHHIKYTNEIIDQKLIGKNIRRLGNYVNYNTPINFQCLNQNCNHIWKTAPAKIISINKQHGCPCCNSSRGEKIILELLKQYNISYIYQKGIRDFNKEYPNYRIDFYFPDINLAIEYNGQQHYEPVQFLGISKTKARIRLKKQKKRDRKLKKICKDNDIELIRIDGRKYQNKKLKQYILKNIIPLIKI